MELASLAHYKTTPRVHPWCCPVHIDNPKGVPRCPNPECLHVAACTQSTQHSTMPECLHAAAVSQNTSADCLCTQSTQ